MASLSIFYDNAYREQGGVHHFHQSSGNEFDRLIKTLALLILFPVLFPLYVMNLLIHQFIFISIASASMSGLAVSIAIAPINPLASMVSSVFFVGTFFLALKTFENSVGGTSRSYFDWLT